MGRAVRIDEADLRDWLRDGNRPGDLAGRVRELAGELRVAGHAGAGEVLAGIAKMLGEGGEDGSST